MSFLQSQILMIIRHQFYRSFAIALLLFTVCFILLPSHYLQDRAFNDLKRIFSADFKGVPKEHQLTSLERIDASKLSNGNPQQFNYYWGEMNEVFYLIKQTKEESYFIRQDKPTYVKTNRVKSVSGTVGNVAELAGEHFEKPKVALAGKLLKQLSNTIDQKTQEKVEKEAKPPVYVVMGHVIPAPQNYVTALDQQVLSSFNEPALLISPFVYKIPLAFWALLVVAGCFMINVVYLAIRICRYKSYGVSRIKKYSTLTAFEEVDQSLENSIAMNSLHEISDGCFNDHCLYIRKYTKFYVIKFTDLLGFSAHTGRVLLRRAKLPVNMHLSPSSVVVIGEFLSQHYPELLIQREDKRVNRGEIRHLVKVRKDALANMLDPEDGTEHHWSSLDQRPETKQTTIKEPSILREIFSFIVSEIIILLVVTLLFATVLFAVPELIALFVIILIIGAVLSGLGL